MVLGHHIENFYTQLPLSEAIALSFSIEIQEMLAHIFQKAFLGFFLRLARLEIFTKHFLYTRQIRIYQKCGQFSKFGKFSMNKVYQLENTKYVSCT